MIQKKSDDEGDKSSLPQKPMISLNHLTRVIPENITLLGYPVPEDHLPLYSLALIYIYALHIFLPHLVFMVGFLVGIIPYVFSLARSTRNDRQTLQGFMIKINDRNRIRKKTETLKYKFWSILLGQLPILLSVPFVSQSQIYCTIFMISSCFKIWCNRDRFHQEQFSSQEKIWVQEAWFRTALILLGSKMTNLYLYRQYGCYPAILLAQLGNFVISYWAGLIFDEN